MRTRRPSSEAPAREGSTGPVFIVGMSRSGTKLLRDLLNRHARVAFPTIETQFLPMAVQRLGRDTEFTDNVLREFFEIVRTSPFYLNARSEGLTVDEDTFIREVDRSDWTTVTRDLLMASVVRRPHEPAVWGDKTPAYLAHLDLLESTFSGARFVHIVRDPRDRCLSVRNVWGKSVYRAAHRWARQVSRASKFGKGRSRTYVEVRFEDLLAAPEKTMRRVSRFLGIEYRPEMTSLADPSEHHGDAAGATRLVRGNTGKYLEELSEGEIRRVEEITFDAMQPVGYRPDIATARKDLSAAALRAYRAYDAIQVLLFHVNEKGLWGGVQYVARLRRVNTWRR